MDIQPVSYVVDIDDITQMPLPQGEVVIYTTDIFVTDQ
jgi:hypothetical protein